MQNTTRDISDISYTDDFFDFPVDDSARINEYLTELNKINYQLAKLKHYKDHLEKLILQETKRVDYDDEGNIINISKEGCFQHLIGKYKVTIKTLVSSKINKAEYEVYKSQIRPEFNPVKTSVEYTVSNKILNDVRLYGSIVDNETLDKFLTYSFSKPNVSLELNV